MTLGTLLLSLARDRAALKRMGAVIAAAAVMGGAYAFLAPPWYRSKITVLPVKQPRGGGSPLAGLVGGDLGALAGLAESAGVGGGADVPRIQAVLQSVTVSDAVIREFDLGARYGDRYIEDTRRTLWRHCAIKALPKPALVELSCEDKDPAFVQRMLSFFAERGNAVFRVVSVSSATEEVKFLERRVQELRQASDETSARMREFQERYRVIDIDSQSKAVVSSLAALDAQRISKQLELDYARTFSSGDEATLRQIESQLRVIEGKLRDLEQATPEAEQTAPPAPGAPGSRARKGVFPQALDVPKLRAEFEKLMRDRKVAEATLIVALERLESARAAQARDVSTFQILDAPTLPTKRSRPQRLLAIVVCALVGAIAAVALEWMRQAGGLRALLAARPPSPPRPVTANDRTPGARSG